MSKTKQKLTDTQLRTIQLVAGIISAIALIAALFFIGPSSEEKSLLQYLWLIIFAVVMFGRRWVERRFNMRLALYNLAMLDSLALLIIFYVSLLFFAPDVIIAIQNFFVPGGTQESIGMTSLSTALKLLITIGGGLLVIIVGIILPLLRYKKRIEEGTLAPIRLPEPEEIEDEEEEEQAEESSKLSPLERQIMEMTQELDEDEDSDKDAE